MVVHFNPSPWEAETGDQELEARLGYTARAQTQCRLEGYAETQR